MTCTIAPGGLGKTTLAIAEALAMASGKPLLGIKPPERLRVWLWNGEDPRDEIDRRIIAAMKHYNLTAADVEGYFFVNVGRETPLVLAEQTPDGTTITAAVVDDMISEIKRNQIDVVNIDPFVKSHKVTENDNNAIDMVATQWAHIADETNCAIELLHHPRKTGGNEVTVEDGRGAIALVSASRSVRVLNRMTDKDAKNAGVPETEAWRYFRVKNGKGNMAPPSERADWYELISVPLGNGDDVGVAEKWSRPDPFQDITAQDLRAALEALNEGGRGGPTCGQRCGSASPSPRR